MKCCGRICDIPVYRFVMPVIASNMYLLIYGYTALVIDPNINGEAEELLMRHSVQRCTVLLTHEHFDHISGVNWLRKRLCCQVICSQNCGERIVDPRKNGAATFQAMFLNHSRYKQKIITKISDTAYSCCADQCYENVLELDWNGISIRIKETPGHSQGSQLIWIQEKHIFTGDSLIPGKAVITRLPGGDKKAYMEKTLPILLALKAGMQIFPGHEAPQTLYKNVTEIL